MYIYTYIYTYVYRYICEFHLAIVQPCLMDPDDIPRARTEGVGLGYGHWPRRLTLSDWFHDGDIILVCIYIYAVI